MEEKTIRSLDDLFIYAYEVEHGIKNFNRYVLTEISPFVCM